MKDIPCPVCRADVPLDGTERNGQTVFCAFCLCPLKVIRRSPDDPITLVEDI
ncbi:MAG: hypothetical protein GXP52_10725 [Deltaproteobacteria bacterium]|nr:hypothetical protein [Deltaproteobacteria bacterium]